jgi:hypothetical protein
VRGRAEWALQTERRLRSSQGITQLAVSWAEPRSAGTAAVSDSDSSPLKSVKGKGAERSPLDAAFPCMPKSAASFTSGARTGSSSSKSVQEAELAWLCNRGLGSVSFDDLLPRQARASLPHRTVTRRNLGT